MACKQSERHPCKSGVSFSICTIYERFRPTAEALDAPKNLTRGWALFFKRGEMHHYFARLIVQNRTAYLQILHGLFFKLVGTGSAQIQSGYDKYAAVPTAATQVASGDGTEGDSKVEAFYGVYAAEEQAPGTYTGGVVYTLTSTLTD